MSLTMNEAETKQIDSQVEQMMDWAKSRRAEAEQLALDSARLMSCTADRMSRLHNQGFFLRCWSRFTGASGAMERANANDLTQMQKMALRYINMLQEQQLLMAHSMLSLKNNLLSLAVKEEETRNLIALLAERTLNRFNNLEHRVEQLEISTNLQGWLLTLEEREYDEKFPTKYMRLFKIINDFYGIKNDNWNYSDLMFMRKAIRTVQLDPKEEISINNFIDALTDEIQTENIGFDRYSEAVTFYAPNSIENYSKYVIDNISSPIYISIHDLKRQYMDRLDMVEELQDEMNCSIENALKRLIKRGITKLSVNLNYKMPLAEIVMEILGSMRLVQMLATCSKDGSVDNDSLSEEIHDEYTVNIEERHGNTDRADEASSTTDNDCPNLNNIDNISEHVEFKIKNNDKESTISIDWMEVNLPIDANDKIVSVCTRDTEWLAISEKGKLLSSQNGVLWNIIHDFEKEFYCNCHSLFCIEKNIFLVEENRPCFYSMDLWNDCTRWAELYRNDRCSFDYSRSFFQILKFDDRWILALNTEKKHRYKKKGIIWDSEEHFWYHQTDLYSTAPSMDLWNEFDEFVPLPSHYAIVSNIIVFNDTIFAVIGDYVGGDNDVVKQHISIAYIDMKKKKWVECKDLYYNYKGIFLTANNKLIYVDEHQILISSDGKTKWKKCNLELNRYRLGACGLCNNICMLGLYDSSGVFSLDGENFIESHITQNGDFKKIFIEKNGIFAIRKNDDGVNYYFAMARNS